MVNEIKIYKTLTRNDTGETKSHQSGITIPKEIANTEIFPRLGIDELNPRIEIIFFDEEKIAWKFQYIYYNDIYFGKEKKRGHDEHRLTCVTKYIKQNLIKSGDSIWFSIDENNVRKIGFERAKDEGKVNEYDNNIIKLSNGWRYIEIKGGLR